MVLQRNRRRQRKKKGGGAPPPGALAAAAAAGRLQLASEDDGAGSSGEITCSGDAPRLVSGSGAPHAFHDDDTSFFSPVSSSVHLPGGGAVEMLGKPRQRQARAAQGGVDSRNSVEKREYGGSGEEGDGVEPREEEGEWSVTDSDGQYSKHESDDDEFETSPRRIDNEEGDSSYSSPGEEVEEGYDDESNPPLDMSGDDEGEDDEYDEDEDEYGDSAGDLSQQEDDASPGSRKSPDACGSGGASRETTGSVAPGVGSAGAQGDAADADDDAARANMESDMYFTESDDEDAKEYKKGGYHPVEIGEIYNRRYRIEAKLGWGHFSTVWLATDLQSSPLEYVAIKFQKSAKHYTEAAVDEVHLLTAVKKGVENAIWREASKSYSDIVKERLAEAGPLETNNSCLPPPPFSPTSSRTPPPVVVFKENFTHKGPHGEHMCLVFEVLGPNLLSLIKRFNFRGLPMNLVRRVATDVLYGLSYLHDVCDIIHTDLKPENVCVSAYPLPPPVPPTGGAGLVPSLLSAESRKRERRKRKKQNRKQRKKAQAAAEAAAAEKDGAEEKLDKGEAAEDDEEDDEPGAENAGEDAEGGKDAEGQPQAAGDLHGAAAGKVEDQREEESAENTPPYVKGKLRPSRSDPSLLTSYTDSIHAVQGTLNKHMYNYVGYSQFRSPAAYCCPRSGRRVMYWLPIDYDEREEACDAKDKGPQPTGKKGGKRKKGKKAKAAAGEDAKAPTATGAQVGGDKPAAPAKKNEEGDAAAAAQKKKRVPGKEAQQLPLLHDDLLLHPVAEGIYAKQQKASPGGGAGKGDSPQGDAAAAKKGEEEGTTNDSDVLMWGPYVKLAPGEDPPKEMTVVNTTEGRICIKPLPPSSFVFEQPRAVYKLCDLGNACWGNEHFTEDIQTRQYRSPEVIIRAGYDCSADVWSFACMLFELITGDYLFDPKSSQSFDRDEDHLALIIELLGLFPTDFVSRGRLSNKYFRGNSSQLRRIQQLRFWPLDAVLREKYHLPAIEAESLSDFLLPMLVIDPQHRQSAAQMLQHPWLRMRTMQDEIVYAQMRRNMHVSHPAIDGLLHTAPAEEEDAPLARPAPRSIAAHDALTASLVSGAAPGASQAALVAAQHLAHTHLPYESLFAAGLESAGAAAGTGVAALAAPPTAKSPASPALVGGTSSPLVAGAGGASAPARNAYASGALEAAVAALARPSAASSAPGASSVSLSSAAVGLAVVSGGVGAARLPGTLSPVVTVEAGEHAGPQPDQTSPVSACSPLASHPAYPLAAEPRSPLPPAAAAGVAPEGAPAAGERGEEVNSTRSGGAAAAFLGDSPLTGATFHLGAPQQPVSAFGAEVSGAAGSLFSPQLPPQELQQLLMLLPAEKQQALLQEHSVVSAAARAVVDSPVAVRGTISLDGFDQTFLVGRVEQAPTTSSPPSTSFALGRGTGLRTPLSARPSVSDQGPASAAELAAVASSSARGPVARLSQALGAEEQLGSADRRSESFDKQEQLRQQVLAGVASSIIGADRRVLNSTDGFAAMQQQSCSSFTPLGTPGDARVDSRILGTCASDLDFSSEAALTTDVAGADARGAVHVLLPGADGRSQPQASRSTLPSSSASGSFPWPVQGQQQITSAELLAAFKQDQRQVGSCFSFDSHNAGPVSSGAQVKAGGASDLKQHIPYGTCAAQQLALAGAPGVESFGSQQVHPIGGGRENAFSGVTRKEDERGWQPTAVAACQQWRPDCPSINFHPFPAHRHQQLEQLVSQDGVQRQMQHKFQGGEKDQREKLKQQLLRQQEDLTRLLGRAQQQFQQQQQLQQQ
ncbi:putative cell-cycle-associated protein kinase SRPK [Besnoitia besnoiti]|uniref:non-specific serine/threonine protein kinase n=1 Tax=Besnoitia besnoiti TaxID=94643 RepID=A0A2A9M2L2_BESBE|nr:putative cell-cycle-associated protein kinase SRPK [Besnoitia besnoiti]PFH32728.1 putative cell-cycle-associated protein kinase SRPK [Besnoitia besnoiti]